MKTTCFDCWHLLDEEEQFMRNKDIPEEGLEKQNFNGALLFDPHHGIREYFGDHVPALLAQQWSATGSKQLIAQAELLPVVVAKRTWSRLLEDRKILVFYRQ